MPDDSLTLDSINNDWPELLRKIRARTPARVLAGRTGASYRTATQLDLREAHAAARDAVRAELDLKKFAADFIQRCRLFEVSSAANSKEEYLLHPNQGRAFSEATRAELQKRCPAQRDLQIAIGDGLSVTAVYAQVPALFEALVEGAKTRGWTVGQPFIIRHCRVGILNEIGDLLNPAVAVLLIGERPGLATAESLSAYLAYRPNRSHTDANRNLISNIHARGVTPADASTRILNLATAMMKAKHSGTKLQVDLTKQIQT
jgi:ethanolamine ammonia-lyase small subunit